MKNTKRILGLFLVVVFVFSSITTTAFAQEVIYEDDTNSLHECEFEFSTSTFSNVDDTFFMYNGEHTGSKRTYNGNYIRYSITITDLNGNPANNIIAVRLFDSNDNLKSEGQFWADGSTTVIWDIPISSNQSYYFKYLLAYGSNKTFKIHMVITPYN